MTNHNRPENFNPTRARPDDGKASRIATRRDPTPPKWPI